MVLCVDEDARDPSGACVITIFIDSCVFNTQADVKSGAPLRVKLDSGKVTQRCPHVAPLVLRLANEISAFTCKQTVRNDENKSIFCITVNCEKLRPKTVE